MAQAVADLAAQQGPAFKQAERILCDLIKAEVAEREVRSIQYQLKSARFPVYRDLAGFKLGGPGTGKTHLATAISVQAIMHHHRRVRFFSTIELVNLLETEKAAGKPGQLAVREGGRSDRRSNGVPDVLARGCVVPAIARDQSARRSDGQGHRAGALGAESIFAGACRQTFL